MIAKELGGIKSTLGEVAKSLGMLYNELAGTPLNGKRGALWRMSQNEAEIAQLKESLAQSLDGLDKIISANRVQHESDIASLKATIKNYQYLWTGAVGVLMFIVGWLGKYVTVLVK